MRCVYFLYLSNPSLFHPRSHLLPICYPLDQDARSGDQRITLFEAVDRAPLLVARRLVWLFLRPSPQLASDELRLRDQLLTHRILVKATRLAQDFQRVVRERTPRALDAWLKACEAAGIPELANLAAGLRQGYPAVKAALTTAWRNGQTEGRVNKLKLLKRQMYGRANFDLLRLRFLYPT